MRNDLTKNAPKIAVLLLAANMVLAQQPAKPAGQPETQPRLTLMGTIRKFMPRVGAKIDESKSTPDLIVSNYTDPKGGKVTIVIVNERRKQLLGFYVYNFGSLKKVRNRDEIYKYLLAANDAITIGSFFVDGDLDIGYKYFVSTEQPPNIAVFQSIYVTMAAVARERRVEITRLVESGER